MGENRTEGDLSLMWDFMSMVSKGQRQFSDLCPIHCPRDFDPRDIALPGAKSTSRVIGARIEMAYLFAVLFDHNNNFENRKVKSWGGGGEIPATP